METGRLLAYSQQTANAPRSASEKNTMPTHQPKTLTQLVESRVSDWCYEHGVDDTNIRPCITVVQDNVCMHLGGLDLTHTQKLSLQDHISKGIIHYYSQYQRKSAFIYPNAFTS